MKNITYYTLKNVSLTFPVYNYNKSLRTEAIIAAKKAIGGQIDYYKKNSQINALRDMSFEIKKGDKIGLYGHNGSGKTTLLRVLAGIYTPTSGSIEIKGKIHSLLDITSGMEPEASGIDNIILRSLTMGIEREEIDSKLDQIIEFSELGEYINFPMKIYSSGMKMRLAFAVSTAYLSDVLLLDEWLSVGDKNFSEKAESKLKSLTDSVGALVLASQSFDLLEKHCNKIFELNSGVIKLII